MIDNYLYSLYLIATPIGNMDDITYRAIEVLGLVDTIASEDTRKTGLLLKKYNIQKPQLLLFEHNEDRAIEKIMSLLSEGKKVAILTSAGTPGISDPGYKIVQYAIAKNISFTMLPGPSALIMAVVLSGLPIHSFTFRGFPPRKTNARKKFLIADKSSPYTLIYYESPHRLKQFLSDALEVFGDRKAAIANDLTKYYETVKRGNLSTLKEEFDSIEILGEYVIVIDGDQLHSHVSETT
jgi:16S rRNA (cytidine1402-2'-O)-methyltransferase